MAAAVGEMGPESDGVALAVVGGKGFASGAYSSALSVALLGAAISWKPVSEMGVRCCGSKLTSSSLFFLRFWVGSNIGKGLNSGVLAFALEKFLISSDNSG